MLDREATAAQTCASVEALFVNNRRARRFQLQTELSETRQGDSSISVFCARLKFISDALRDAGKTLDDDELVIQLLRGVNKDRHQTTAKIIEKSPTPIPFDVAVGMLLHDEIGNNFAGSTHHSALAVQQRGPSPAPSGVASGGRLGRPPPVSAAANRILPHPTRGTTNAAATPPTAGIKAPPLHHRHGRGRSMPTPWPCLLHHARRLASSAHGRHRPMPPSAAPCSSSSTPSTRPFRCRCTSRRPSTSSRTCRRLPSSNSTTLHRPALMLMELITRR
ncbi:uncharacterized protein [Triticum aestivum]|uniref:uncharacterized protein n=1 Tax=Triticum aestivum TaxID=4565 RepID=UPI001D00D008|nr:uncharacterized protein LOC123162080 [Triticum aestivum]